MGARSSRSVPIWGRLLAIPVVIAITLLGLWVTAGQITSNFVLSMVLSGVWFGIATLIALAIGVRWRPLALPVLGTFVITAGVATVLLFVSTFTDKTVDETIAEAAPSSSSSSSSSSGSSGNTLLVSGEIVGQAHGAGGEASVVELPEGSSVLTLADLETDNGPDLRVYMVDGTVQQGSINGDFIDLGALKGNIGNQQYEIPADVDPATYSTVTIWCRAFSVSFAMADLQPS